MLARMGRLLPDEGVDIGDKLGRRAVAKGADAVDEERLALWKNGRHRIVEGSCDRIAVQPPARLRLAPAEGGIARHYPRCFTHRRPFTNRPQALTDSHRKRTRLHSSHSFALRMPPYA